MSDKRRQLEEQGLDLVPIMNLVTILIPFLLMSAQFVNLAVIDSMLPAIVESEPVEEKPDEEKLDLKVMINDKGFTVAGADKILPEEAGENGRVVPCHEDGCPTPESYDVASLTDRLALIKDQHEDEENVVLVPDSSVSYEVIIRTMDATRDDQDDRDSDNRPRRLFPNVVLAGGVK